MAQQPSSSAPSPALLHLEGAERLANAVPGSDGVVARAVNLVLPRMVGGPMFAADQVGLAAVLAEVEEAARVGGAGSEPSPLLVRLAQGRGSFAAWQENAHGT